MKDIIIDNQQVKLFIATAWLAGMIDADGCISYTDKGGRGKQIVPIIDIASSCKGTTSVLYKTIKLIGGAPFVTRQYKQTGCYTTRISGYKRVAYFLPFIIPFLVTKKDEAEKMLLFVTSRLSTKKTQEIRHVVTKDGREYDMKVSVKPISEEDKKTFQEIKDIKVNRSLRDYNPDVLWLQGEDIVRSHDESMS
jgi:hypothetical protein